MIKTGFEKSWRRATQAKKLRSTGNCRSSIRNDNKDDAIFTSGGLCSVFFSTTSPFENSHALGLINWSGGLSMILVVRSLSGRNVSGSHLLRQLWYLKGGRVLPSSGEPTRAVESLAILAPVFVYYKMANDNLWMGKCWTAIILAFQMPYHKRAL